jgi:hypothetical protein
MRQCNIKTRTVLWEFHGYFGLVVLTGVNQATSSISNEEINTVLSREGRLTLPGVQVLGGGE